MLPPKRQLNFESIFSASCPLTFTLLQDPVQSSAVQGMQGMGVSTPNAAAVAAATMGFAGLEHIPKGRMFKNGI